MKRLRLLLALLCCLGALRPLLADEPMPATVRITVNTPAFISVNYGKPTEQVLNHTVKVPPSTATLIKVAAPGYRTQYKTVKLEAGERRPLAFELERLQVPVLFRCNVPATVTLDGNTVGETPCHLFLPEKKNYTFLFRAQNYEQERYALVLRDDTPKVVDITLKQIYGEVEVNCTPTARLQLNGVEKGLTPVHLEKLRDGKHTISLEAEGFRRFEHTFVLEAGTSSKFNFALEPLPATLTVTTEPAKARVYLDNVYRGESNLAIPNVPEGTHTLRVEKEGHAPITRQVSLKRNTAHEERIDLAELRGTLCVQTQPAVVEVYHGNKKLLTTQPLKKDSYTSAPTRIPLPEGSYEITLKANGYAPKTQTVTIVANQEASLKLRLTFRPNFELQTESGVVRGVFIRKSAELNSITVETSPGVLRTFRADEITAQRFLPEAL